VHTYPNILYYWPRLQLLPHLDLLVTAVQIISQNACFIKGGDVYPPVLWYDVPLGTRRWLRTSCTMRMVISFVACADYIDTTSYWNYWNFFRIFRWCSILTAHFFIFSFIFIHSAIEWNSLASYCCTIIFLMNGYLMSISNNCLAGIQCVTSIPFPHDSPYYYLFFVTAIHCHTPPSVLYKPLPLACIPQLVL